MCWARLQTCVQAPRCCSTSTAEGYKQWLAVIFQNATCSACLKTTLGVAESFPGKCVNHKKFAASGPHVPNRNPGVWTRGGAKDRSKSCSSLRFGWPSQGLRLAVPHVRKIRVFVCGNFGAPRPAGNARAPPRGAGADRGRGPDKRQRREPQRGSGAALLRRRRGCPRRRRRRPPGYHCPRGGAQVLHTTLDINGMLHASAFRGRTM